MDTGQQMDKWQQQIENDRQEGQSRLRVLHNLAREVAGALPGDWTLDEKASFHREQSPWPGVKIGDLRDPEIILTDGRRLEFSYTRDRPRRLAILGRLPQYADGRYYSFSSYEEAASLKRTITVSPDKDAGTIARDIERRLMPDYSKAFNIAREKIAALEGEEARRRVTIKAVAKIAGTVASDRDLQMNICPVFYVGRARCEVRHSTTIHIEADLDTPEELEAIKPYLKERKIS